jgi:hypothetical protein
MLSIKLGRWLLEALLLSVDNTAAVGAEGFLLEVASEAVFAVELTAFYLLTLSWLYCVELADIAHVRLLLYRVLEENSLIRYLSNDILLCGEC